MSEQQAAPAGFFSWNELMTGDTETCKAFYTQLFGWEAMEMDMESGKYTVFQKNGVNVGGMMGITPEMGPIPPHWMGYVTVDDVDASTETAAGLGAQVFVPPTDIPGIGRFSVIQDPAGAAISLITFLPMEGQ